ncbi:WD40-like Beta Propeller Repeat [Saccharicrinis carchari]|uniref:WD40-like Beta Propeller Repeat n=2 Tax=Saccharicrinis carchari TaxID=1168039 RepID=A0A521BEF4_SACCC|nr:WD40-like Beta Propeller Repeat [Saccharicrinis carchari]
MFVAGHILSAQGKYVKKGDKLYHKGEYYQALLSYTQAKEEGEEINTDVTKKIATCYFELNDTQSAFNTFGEVMDELSGNDLVTFAKTLQKEGGYEMAIEYYQMAKADGVRVDEVDDLIAACKWAVKHAEMDQNVRVIPSAIYTAGQSFGTVYYKDGVVYSSAPKDTNNKNLDKTGKAFLDLYYSDLIDHEIQEGRLFSEKLQFQYHIGAIAFTSDYNTMYYTLAVRVKGGNRLKIFKVQYDGKDWGKSEELPFNSIDYDCVMPAVSPDDKFLYFVSNKKGGYGGKDIYKVERLRGGAYGTMSNLGPEVNTYGNEEFPSINKTNELFFSSDGHIGYGGLDIFKSEFKNGKWQKPQNLLLPFNSPKDDFAYTINPKDPSRGFLSSNRRGANDDIFYVELLQQEKEETQQDNPEVGDVIEIAALPEVKEEPAETASNLSVFPMAVAAKIKSTFNNEVAQGVQVQVLDKNSATLIGTAVSDAKGNFNISIPDKFKKEGQVFELVFTKEGEFNPKRMIVDISEINDINQNGIALTPMFNDTVLDDISGMILYYNGTELLEESKRTLERLAGYLQSNPQIVVKLNTHSDARGSKYDNLLKTQKMGEKVQQMLQDKGVDEESTIPRGYGERYIVNRCKRGVLCSEEEQQKNKRIEVIVWKVKE